MHNADETADSPPLDARQLELICATRGHLRIGPTGPALKCLRCSRQLDGLGLDPSLRRHPNETETR